MMNRNYINQLKVRADEFMRVNLGNGSCSQKKIQPLVEQIEALIKSFPPQLLNRPWLMSEFVARLEGQYRARPHPQKVAEALRSLGWERVRNWKKGFDGVRVWLPPS